MKKSLAIALAAATTLGLAAPAAQAAPQESATSTQAAPAAGHVSPYVVLFDLLRKCDAQGTKCDMHHHYMGQTFPGTAFEKFWLVTDALNNGPVTLVTEYVGGVEGSGTWTTKKVLTQEEFYSKLFAELKSEEPNENVVYPLIRDYWMAATGTVITIALPSAPPRDNDPTPTAPAGK